MQFIDISEPGQNSAPKGVPEYCVGIDFGTTNSLVTFSKNHTPRILRDMLGRDIVPSVIEYLDGKFEVGANASNHGISSIKRFMGKSVSEVKASPVLYNLVKDIMLDDSETIRLQFGGRAFTVPEIAAEIFKHLKTIAENSLSANVDKAVVTVPAYFDSAAKGEVILAAKIAGLEVLRLIAEPTAAAYAYGLNKNSSGHYLVYDLGGGTFDVSILNMQEGVFQVIATGGDNMLGGDDIDHLIADYFLQTYKLPEDKALLRFAKTAKEALTSEEKFERVFKETTISLSRHKLNEIIYPLLERSLKIAQGVLESSDITTLDGIILVGGSTRIPLIQELLNKNFSAAIFSDIDPDRSVSIGASYQAENLTYGNSSSLLIDVVPLSLGMEMYGGLVEKIILRNSPTPLSVTKEFTTYADNQTGMKFHIVQGEREMVEDCRSLARFELKGLTPLPAGRVNVEVTFAIDVDGILSVSALDKASAQSQTIEVKPSYGLDAKEINLILENAYKNARIDHETRLLQEAKLEGKSLLSSLTKATKETPNVVSKEEMEDISYSIQKLNQSIEGKDRELILSCIEDLNNVSSNFIANRINYAITSSLAGKNVDDV